MASLACAALASGCTSQDVTAPSGGTIEGGQSLGLESRDVPDADLEPSEPQDTKPRREQGAPEVTRCREVRFPRAGLGEADFSLDKTRQLLTINFSDTRRGSYRNISYTVRYNADPSCRRVPQMADAIARVLPRR